jgi:hypothetical protein
MSTTADRYRIVKMGRFIVLAAFLFSAIMSPMAALIWNSQRHVRERPAARLNS